MTKEQFYLHTLADHWQEMGYPYAADLLRHHANEGVPAFREIVGGSPQVSERAPQGGGPVIFGTPDLGGGHNQAKLTFYHVHPDGQQQRLGSVGFTRPEGHAVMRTLQAAGHKGAEIDAARTLPEGWKAPKAHQSFLPTLNTARPEAPEQDYRPNEVLPEDYYGYSRKRKYAAIADGGKAAHFLRALAGHWRDLGYKAGSDVALHLANQADPFVSEHPNDFFDGSLTNWLHANGGKPVVRAGRISDQGTRLAFFVPGGTGGTVRRLPFLVLPHHQAFALMTKLAKEKFQGARTAADQIMYNGTGPDGKKLLRRDGGEHNLPPLDTRTGQEDAEPPTPEDFLHYSRARLARAKARHDGRKAARKLAKKLGVDPAADAEPYLFPEERDMVLGFRPATRQQFGDLIRQGNADRPGVMPGVGELKSLAQVGEPVRGGYQDAHTTVLHLLRNPKDADRWVTANAILSAQTGWEAHTAGATEALAAWHAAGRPTHAAGLDDVFGLTGRDPRGAAVITSRGRFKGPDTYTGPKANALKSLFAQGDNLPGVEWSDISAGSLKTPNFGKAFVDPRGVPIDTHMAKLTTPGGPWSPSAVRRFVADARLPRGSDRPLLDAQKAIIEKPVAALAYKVLVVQAAKELGWEPRQVQEAVWTAALAVMVAKHTGAAGAPQILARLNRAAVQAGWSLNTVLSRPEVVRDFSRLGIPARRVQAAIAASQRRTPAGPGPVGTSDPAALESVAGRLPAEVPKGARPILDRLTLRRRKYSHQAFAAAIRRKPNDPVVRGAYADYLEENDAHADPETLAALRGPHRVWMGHATDRGGRHLVFARPLPKITMAMIRANNRAIGHNWFTPDSMRFFNTRLERRVHAGPGGTYFVTSDQFSYDRPRRWSVRRANPDGSIETVGNFMTHAYPEDAHEEAADLAAQTPPGLTRMGRPYRAPAGGTVVRGVYYEGGSMIPDLAGPFATGQTPSRPAPPPKSRKINWAAALRRWTGRQRNR